MPIITFLQDIFAATKGPYYQKVGRHTQTFCKRAVKNAKNELQKKMFFVAAICADELIASLVGVDDKRQVAAFKGRALQKTIRKKQITAALRVYLSTILVLTSVQKELLLTNSRMTEEEMLHVWCSIFEYTPADMQLFDTILLPAYQQQGLEELSQTAGKAMLEQLFSTSTELNPAEQETLQNIMLEDAAAVLRVLAGKGDRAV